MTKTQFIQRLGIDLPINWFDGFGIHELDKDRRVIIKLSNNDDGNNKWNGLDLQLVSKTSGKITSATLRFDSYMSGRKDTRKDDLQRPGWGYYAWHSSMNEDVGWYIAVPEHIKPFADAVKAYIAAWK